MKKYLFISLLVLSVFLMSCDKMIPNNTDNPIDTNDNDTNNSDNTEDINDNSASNDTTDDETPSIVNTKVRLFLFDTEDYVM